MAPSVGRITTERSERIKSTTERWNISAKNAKDAKKRGGFLTRPEENHETRNGFLTPHWLVYQSLFDCGVDLWGHGVLDFFGDMADGAKGSADQRESLGDLPRIAHV